MSSIRARTCALSGSNSTTGGSWATSVRTWPGWAVRARARRRLPAAAEYVRRFAAERGQQAVHVVSLLLGRHVMGGVLAAAVAGAARVVRHDGVVVGERAGESGEAGAVHRRADHEQQWAGAALLLVEPCAGHVQGMSRRI